jgi:hypothetical protein
MQQGRNEGKKEKKKERQKQTYMHTFIPFYFLVGEKNLQITLQETGAKLALIK